MFKKIALFLFSFSVICSVSANNSQESTQQQNEKQSSVFTFLFGAYAPPCHDYPHCMNGLRGYKMIDEDELEEAEEASDSSQDSD